MGHLNLIKRAKQYCDYLVVGVHKDASHKGKETFIPLEERMDIVRNIKWVDEVILSMREDCDVYKTGIVKYDYLLSVRTTKGQNASTAMRNILLTRMFKSSISHILKVPAAPKSEI